MGNVEFKKIENMTTYRKIAQGTWSSYGDPSIYSQVDIDFTKGLEFIEKIKKEKGVTLTPSHLVSQAMSLGFLCRPESNTVFRRSRPYLRKDVDIFHQVVIPGEKKGGKRVGGADLSGCVIRKTQEKDIFQIQKELWAESRSMIKKTNPTYLAQKNLFKWLPIKLIRPLLNLVSFLTYDLNLNLSFLGVPKDPFGSIIISNLGVLGSRGAFIPLAPYTRVGMFVAIGKVHKKPTVIDDQVVARETLPLFYTLDHRCADGIHFSDFEKLFRKFMEEPEKYLLKAPNEVFIEYSL